MTPIPTPTTAKSRPDIVLDATPNINKPPAIAANPLPISSHDMPENEVNELDRLSIALAMMANPAPTAIKLKPPPPNLENNAISAKMPAIPANPFIIVSGSIFPNPSTASFNTNNAADKIKTPAADVMLSPPNLAPAMNNANSPNNIAIAPKPVPNTSASIDPIFSNALAIT